MRIGILSLQGAVEPHELKLKSLGVSVQRVKVPEQLKDLSGLILPGGESTTMLHLIGVNKLWESLKEFTSTKPTWGICAGAILLANHVSHPEQKSLEAIDIHIQRNAYGRQNESFESFLEPEAGWQKDKKWEGVFIRAPRIIAVGNSAKTLLRFNQEPVMVEQENVLVSTFHPELTESSQIHQYFIGKC